MERGSSRRGAEGRGSVALQAKQVDVAHFQHVRIGPAVRQMARLASINLDGSMLVHKRPLLVRVTLEADRILRGGSPHLFRLHRTVHVVAITALDQSFIHAMMEGHVELRFLLRGGRNSKARAGTSQARTAIPWHGVANGRRCN